MGYSEEKFKQHIKEVVEAGLEDEGFKERPLTLDELKELALSMGMTSEEWEQLQKDAVQHLKSADDHLSARNYQEAIFWAEKATAINPYIENGNAVLAKAYMMLWMETKTSKHREKAEFHARKELQVDPSDQMAVNVLSTIRKKQNILEGEHHIRKKLLIGFIVLATLLGIFYFFTLPSGADPENQQENSSSSAPNNSLIQNQLIEAEEEVYSKWDMVQTAINRRNNLVPDLISVIDQSSEADRLDETIESLKERITLAEGEEKFRLENELQSAINEAKKIAKANGESEHINNLMMQIESSENRITYEKKLYNEAVKAYNILLKKNLDEFPNYEIKPYFNG